MGDTHETIHSKTWEVRLGETEGRVGQVRSWDQRRNIELQACGRAVDRRTLEVVTDRRKKSG